MGQRSGFFSHVDVSDRKVDLHDCPASVACAAVVDVLESLKDGTRQCVDIAVVTGRGNGSEGDAVLPTAVRQFLACISAPPVTDVPFNPGRFILSKRDIQLWLAEQ